MEYYGIIPGQNGKVANITKWLVAIIAVFMGYKGVQAGLWYYIPLAIGLIIVAFFKKEQVISPKGLDVRRVFVVYTAHSIWPWEEITRVHANFESMKPGAVLTFSRDNKKRQVIMRGEDARAVLKMGRKINPGLQVEEVDASGVHKSYQYNRDGGKKNDASEETVQLAENFAEVKEELARKADYSRFAPPDPAKATVRRPDRSLKGFR